MARLRGRPESVVAMLTPQVVAEHSRAALPLLRERYAIQQVVFDEASLEPLQALHRLLAFVVLRCAEPALAQAPLAPLSALRLPLAAPPSALFRSLPAFVVEDVAGLVRTLAQFPRTRHLALLESPFMSFGPVALDFAAFFTALVSAPEHLPKPYLRGELVHALAEFAPSRGDAWHPASDVPPGYRRPPTPALHLHLATFPRAQARTLAAALMSFYVAIGATGSRSNHLDKLPFRVAVMALLEGLVLSTGSEYGAAIVELARDASAGPGVVTDFVCDAMKDADSFWDEAQKLIHDVKEDEHNVAQGAPRVRNEHRPEETPDMRVASYLREIRRDLEDARAQLRALSLLTRAGVTHPWLSRRLRGSAALFLNSLFLHLCGSGRAGLRLTDAHMAEARFRPRELLIEAAGILGALAAAGPLCGAEPDEGGSSWASRDMGDAGDAGMGAGAVAGAGAGAGAGEGEGAGQQVDVLASSLVTANAFALANFAEARRLLLDPGQREQRDVAAAVAPQLRALHSRLETRLGAQVSLDAALGELPGELEDPLTFNLLSDPVLLPVSRTIVQRADIVQSLQLSGDGRDPWSRTPLAPADFVELPELKAAAAAWVAARRRREDGAAELEAVRRLSEEARQAPR